MSATGDSRPTARWQPPTAEELHKLLPEYDIEKMLGRGGMGAVYMGRQLSLDRPVAIKILSAALEENDRSFAERFKNEARAMAQLNHPAIVSVYEFGAAPGGLWYIVMEYVEGTDVSRMLAQQGKLPPEHAMAITAHVCDALACAHARGIIHRDIKPANIMVSADGVVKVADFGLAKMNHGGETGLTQSGMALGTLHYMAPEALMLGTAVDHRADIYAVGVMLYQMLTGALPQGHFKLPSQLVTGLDPRYDDIIAKTLREDREARYQRITALRADLDLILTTPHLGADGSAIAAVPPEAVVAEDSADQALDEDAEEWADAAVLEAGGAIWLRLAAVLIIALSTWFIWDAWQQAPAKAASTAPTLVAAPPPTKTPEQPAPAATPSPAPVTPPVTPPAVMVPAKPVVTTPVTKPVSLPLPKRPTRKCRVEVWRIDGQPVNPNDPEAMVPPGLDDAVAIMSNGSNSDPHIVTVLRADGSVLAWGEDISGAPVTPPQKVLDLHNIAKLGTGQYPNFVTDTGGLGGWHWNAGSPTQGRALAGKNGTICIDHANTWYGAFAIQTNGTLASKGAAVKNPVFNVPLQAREGVVAMHIQWAEAVVAKTDGSLVFWGKQGAAMFDKIPQPTFVPTRLHFMPGTLLAAFGANGECAVWPCKGKQLPKGLDVEHLEDIQSGYGTTALRQAGHYVLSGSSTLKLRDGTTVKRDLDYCQKHAEGCIALEFLNDYVFGLRPVELTGPAIARLPPPGAPLFWKDEQGRNIIAGFVGMAGDQVLLLIDGKTVPFPLSRLAPASQQQARQLAGAAPSP